VALLAVLTGWATPASSGPAHPVAEAPVQQEPAGPEADDSTTTTAPAPPDQDIIPEPNSGQPPRESGDRGGILQLAVLVLILVGIGIVAWRIVHESRRNRGHDAPTV
jgi:hypothetical protein